MVTKEDIDAALAADETAAADLRAARDAKQKMLTDGGGTVAEVAAVSAEIVALRSVYDGTHAAWAELRRQYLADKGAEAARVIGGR
jgi:hypothetical protein